MVAKPARPSLLLVGGLGRSGSTLLELALSAFPGVVAVGELRYIWQQGLAENLKCGCGAAFYDCPFWTAVGDFGFGGWTNVDSDAMIAVATRADRHRYLPGYVARWAPTHPRPLAQSEYLDVLRRLYHSIATVSGAAVIVDTSKDPPHAFLCEQLDLDMQVVHLVRDCRGVAYSWSRLTSRPEVAQDGVYMARYGPLNVAARWWDYNLLFELLGWRLGARYRRLRYEDFVKSPNRYIVEVLQTVGVIVGEKDPRLVTDGVLAARVCHSVGGNPMRFQSGPRTVRLDTAWHRSMSRKDRLAVTVVASPLLVRYGYRLTSVK